MAGLLTIGEVADAVGLARSTLRYYDDIGLVEPTERRGGQRRYSPQAVHRLRVVNLGRQAGFTLDEISRLLDGGGDWRELARRRREELATRIDELQQAQRVLEAALACGCEDLEGCRRTDAARSNEDASWHHAASLTDPTRR